MPGAFFHHDFKDTTLVLKPYRKARKAEKAAEKANAKYFYKKTMYENPNLSSTNSIRWVGLLIPHAARMVCGSDNKRIVPISMALGSAFMVLIDTAARSITAAEIPVSILTAIIGAPFFILLLRRTRGARL